MSKPTDPEHRGLSRPLIELIDWPSDEAFRTIARILKLEQIVQERLDREAQARQTEANKRRG